MFTKRLHSWFYGYGHLTGLWGGSLPIVSGRPKISPIVFLLTLVLLVLCILGVVLTMRRSAQEAVPVFPPLARVFGSFGERGAILPLQ